MNLIVFMSSGEMQADNHNFIYKYLVYKKLIRKFQTVKTIIFNRTHARIIIPTYLLETMFYGGSREEKKVCIQSKCWKVPKIVPCIETVSEIQCDICNADVVKTLDHITRFRKTSLEVKHPVDSAINNVPTKQTSFSIRMHKVVNQN